MTFIGCKTVAWLDVWSFEHFIVGISLGALTAWLRCRFFSETSNTRTMDLLLMLLFAYLWETVEHYLETGLLGDAVQFWFQGVEFWGNRLITDPLCVLAGWYVYMKKPALHIPARIFSMVWLGVHVFVFPHSMYLHTHYGQGCPSFTQDAVAGD